MYRKFWFDQVKNVISEKRKISTHFQKWKENYFSENINFGMSFIIPELNVGP